MSIASDFASGLARTEWAKRFVDSCTIDRSTGSTFNETTGQNEPSTVNVYAGECLWRPQQPRQTEYGEDSVQVARGFLFLPHDSVVLAENDVAVIVSTLDPELGEVTVKRTFYDSYLTVRKYECEAPNV